MLISVINRWWPQTGSSFFLCRPTTTTSKCKPLESESPLNTGGLEFSTATLRPLYPESATLQHSQSWHRPASILKYVNGIYLVHTAISGSAAKEAGLQNEFGLPDSIRSGSVVCRWSSRTSSSCGRSTITAAYSHSSKRGWTLSLSPVTTTVGLHGTSTAALHFTRRSGDRFFGIATRRIVLGSVAIVDQVDAAQICVSVIVSGLVARRSGRLSSWWTWLFVGITVGTNDKRGVIAVVQPVSNTASCYKHTNEKYELQAMTQSCCTASVWSVIVRCLTGYCQLVLVRPGTCLTILCISLVSVCLFSYGPSRLK